jgi:hypothetical protein
LLVNGAVPCRAIDFPGENGQISRFTAFPDAPPNGNDAPAVDGDAVIRGKAGGSEIVIKTTSRLAGAIDSLTWDGKEFIDSFDHGRQLQSAASFDVGRSDEFWAERFNPTEAGSRLDHTGGTSTSRLLKMEVGENELASTVRMAFWLAPGEESFGRPGLSPAKLSDHRLSKNVRIGWGDVQNVVRYKVTFHVAPNEPHRYAQFEALTGYMPEEFSEFWYWRPAEGDLRRLDDGPGEQPYPVIFSTADHRHAMAVYCPEGAFAKESLNLPAGSGQMTGPSYGRFRFAVERVVKWNCVFRVRNPAGIVAGDYTFDMFVVVGSLDQVRQSLQVLAKGDSR